LAIGTPSRQKALVLSSRQWLWPGCAMAPWICPLMFFAGPTHYARAPIDPRSTR
jgi:hypothetical protein